MVRIKEERRLIKIVSRGVIRHLRGGMMGPIMSPYYEKMGTVKMIVQEGHEVHFVNPVDFKQTVRVTLENIRRTNDELFPSKVKEEDYSKEEVETPKKEDKETEKEEVPKQTPKQKNKQKNKRNNDPVEDKLTKPE